MPSDRMHEITLVYHPKNWSPKKLCKFRQFDCH